MLEPVQMLGRVVGREGNAAGVGEAEGWTPVTSLVWLQTIREGGEQLARTGQGRDG